MQKLKHLAESAPLVWLGSIHIRMHGCIPFHTAVLYITQALNSNFTEAGAFSFVCLLGGNITNTSDKAGWMDYCIPSLPFPG